MENTLECESLYISEIDKALMAGLEMDAKLSYGIATRQHTYNGNIINVSSNERLPTDGEIALWDDRYSIVWFHRINGASIEVNDNGKYGRLQSSVKETLDIDLVIWASVKYRYQGQIKTIQQFELYRLISAILIYRTRAVVRSANFDMPAIGRSEFIDHKIHKECLLLSIKYSLTENIKKDCFCPPPVTDCNII